ncbi:MAG: nucleotidyltransferase domain-containing protein, partial [archaeon]|nr:nucleotidyltransferase domain-containing protein [archaeon]
TPPQAAEMFDEELGLTPEEKKEKPMHMVMIIPEENYKEIGKIKAEVIKIVKDMKPKLWVNIISPVDLANYCLDSKFNVVEALGMSYPLHDKGILATFRVSSIHKSLCLRKFEKYIYSYVIAGSLVRGEGKPTSDIDTYVIIDDTDVKRMSRLELKEKLRGIIYQYVAEAAELSGVKTPLHIQVYLLTEFWEDVKDAAPVIFGFIRDGIPLYDRGGFLPWKLLLKMGKIKPSPEAIDKFMSMGDKTKEIIKSKLLDIVVGDIYWSTLTPSQALLMLYGIPPTNTYETVREMKRVFVDKEKMLEPKYINILEKICIKYYKGFEHQKIKEVSGKEIDELMKESDDYLKRLKELRVDIEKRAEERTLTETYDNVFKLLKGIFGNKSEQELVRHFEGDLVRKAKMDPKGLHVIKELIDAKKRYKTKKKPTKYEIEDIRKNTTFLVNHLIEYAQRADLTELRKMQLRINYKKNTENKHLDLFLTNPTFMIIDNEIKKISDGKIIQSSQEEFDGILGTQKGKPHKLDNQTLSALKKEFEEFEIAF